MEKVDTSAYLMVENHVQVNIRVGDREHEIIGIREDIEKALKDALMKLSYLPVFWDM